MKVYNTLSRQKEEFIPLEKGKVSMYVCGITAYDSCHIGHARAAVAFDIVARYLRYKGFKLTFAKNYTDIDDKIINRANKEKRDWKELADYYINEYAQDMASLGNLKPDIEPKATDHIKEMIGTIKKLVDRGFAYQTKSGVYFSVRKFEGYGKLSGKNIEDLESGARVEVDEEKKDPLDFALWKAGKPGEPKWPSPWGEGRPGWHIECSAMSSKYLKQPFDIHGGGRDLIFPHHENELAQAEGAEGKPFVKYWLHNGFININSEKMSKSLGNIMTIRETLKRYDFETVRYFLLSSHYRSPLDYTEQALAEAAMALDRFYDTMERVVVSSPQKRGSSEINGLPASARLAGALAKRAGMTELAEALEQAEAKITAFMDDDFNTAGVMGVIFDLVRLTNKYLDRKPSPLGGEGRGEGEGAPIAKAWGKTQKMLGEMFGMFNSDPAEYRTRRKTIATTTKNVDDKVIEQLISERATARQSKDFAKADAVKNQLSQMGVELRDKPDGTTEWKIK